MEQNEQVQENQQPIEEIKSGLGSYLQSPLTKWVIGLSILAFIISYLVLRVQYLGNSRLTNVQPTASILPSVVTTATPAVLETPPELCQLAQKLESIINTNNFNELKKLYVRQEVICDKETVGMPFLSPEICNDKVDNKKRFGYLLGLRHSEGSTMSFNKISNLLLDDNKKHGPFINTGLLLDGSNKKIFLINQQKDFGISFDIDDSSDLQIQIIVVGELIEDDNELSRLSLCAASTPTPSLPDFSKEPVKPRTNVDISNWLTFDDPQVGLRFKYPPEWGKTNTQIEKGSKGSKYMIYFDNLEFKFMIGGSSVDYSVGRGSDVNDFVGFNHNVWPYTADDICNDIGVLFCQKIGNTVQVLYGIKCSAQECNPYTWYARYMYVDRPNKNKFQGLVFGGNFLSPYLNTLVMDNQTPRVIRQINKALLDRRLDEETIKNLDTYEKVFETVESY